MSSEQRRRTLNGYRRIRSETRLEQTIETCRIELAESECVRVGKIDDRRVEESVLILEPNHRVFVDHANPRIAERMLVQFSKRRKSIGKAGHRRIEIDQRNFIDRGIAQNLSERQ